MKAPTGVATWRPIDHNVIGFFKNFYIYNQLLPAKIWFNFLVRFWCECNGNQKKGAI